MKKPLKAERRRKPKQLIVFYGSEKLTGREERTKVRQALRAGREPEPAYTTGKFWVD